ncbi:MAG: ATP-binding protein [Aquificota bacterium]|nr:ATP-binding protein [Aquificota bacterium]
MRLSLKGRIIVLLLILTFIPVTLYLYHYTAMKRKLLQDRVNLHTLYATSLVTKVELFLEKVISEASSSLSLYRNLGFSEEEMIWRVTGHVRGVFEGAFYSPEGILMASVSRERIDPDFDSFVDVRSDRRILGIYRTEYEEPFLRFVIPEFEDGLLKGYFVFSLDLSLFWQSVVSSKPGPDVEVFLTDTEGNILAFSDLRFPGVKRIPLRGGVYRSVITGVDVVGVHAKSENGEWVVVVEEPVTSVLAPMSEFQTKAVLAGSVFMTSAGIFAILVFLRIFRPLENLRNYIVSWERENMNRNVQAGDEVSELSQAFENLIRRLEEDRKLYSSLFENTLDGIIVFNVERRVIDVNRTILEQYKLRKEDLLGKSMADLIGEDLPLVSLFFAEKKVRLGEEIYCQLRQEILRIEDSVYILWRLKDVSQEKELKILLEQTAKLSLAGEIACSVAHQINNPLASIMGYAESIALSTSEEETRKKAEVIIRQAGKCAETVKKLLEVGKPFEGKPDYVKPEDITIEVINMLHPKAKRRGVRIEFGSSLNGEKIFTFPWQIEQVLINVVDNAIDACEGGGVVKVDLRKEGSNIVWRVVDTGKGIPKEEISKVFKPFYTTKRYGTGLGLPLAKRFVRNLGGDIRIHSEEGKGTTVEIMISGGQG